MTHRYRKIPVEIEAAHLKEENAERVAEWCGGRVETRQTDDSDGSDGGLGGDQVPMPLLRVRRMQRVELFVNGRPNRTEHFGGMMASHFYGDSCLGGHITDAEWLVVNAIIKARGGGPGDWAELAHTIVSAIDQSEEYRLVRLGVA